MKRKELKEKKQKCKTKEEENLIFEEFWDSNARVRFIFISLFIINITIILGIGLGFIAFLLY